MTHVTIHHKHQRQPNENDRITLDASNDIKIRDSTSACAGEEQTMDTLQRSNPNIAVSSRSKEIDGEDDLVGKELRQGLREARRRAKTEK